MREFLAIASALSDPSRVRLLLCLRDQELCACNLVDFIGLADSTVSKHMSLLRQAGLVRSRKRGRWVYYRLADDNTSPLIQDVLDLARRYLELDPVFLEDADRITRLITSKNGSACAPGVDAREVNAPQTHSASD